jgi:DNA excision repair protein ERCC-6
MGADDALLSELGVTARGERDVARDVIRDAALAAAARAAAARRAPATADAEAAEEGDAGTGAGETRGGAGGGGGADPSLPPTKTHTPATRELCRLREEAGTVAAELASVRDALDDVRAKAAEGTAPADAPLVIAVGERRVAGLVEKRAALRVRVRDAEALASAEADAARTGVSGRAAATPAGRRTKTETPRVAATLAEDDDLDALLDSMSAGGPSARGGDGSSRRSGVPELGSRNDHAGETERERLIRAGVLTPFASLDGFERRVASTSATVNPEAATEHAVAATRAWREGRSRAVLLEGDAVPQQQPAARPFARHGGARAPDVGAGARMAEKRREWRGRSDRAAAALERGGGRKRRRRRQRDAAYSSDEEHTEEEEEAEAEAEDDEGAEGDPPAPAPAPRGRGRPARAPCGETRAAAAAGTGSQRTRRLRDPQARATRRDVSRIRERSGRGGDPRRGGAGALGVSGMHICQPRRRRVRAVRHAAPVGGGGRRRRRHRVRR